MNTITNNYLSNINYIKELYSSDKSKDLIIRNFNVLVNNKRYNSCIVYFDGMADTALINDFILKPLMLRNTATSYDSTNEPPALQSTSNENLSSTIYNKLLPQIATTTVKSYDEITSAINMGNCVLIIDTLDTAFDLDVKGFKQRAISSPSNEIVVRGSQEAFVENLRTNTSILRRLSNTEHLILEGMKIGKITKTQVCIGYIDGIVNPGLVSEIKRRLKGISVDYLTSSGQLEQLIPDNPNSIFPQIIATERPDKVINYLFDGRACIIVNGSPYVLVLPGVFLDFLSSSEDLNLKFHFSNLGKIIRLLAVFFAILLPGMYIAITNYHHDLIPTELLFTIAASRESVPFPTVIEILLMEISFELIREAGLRVPTPLGTTIGIVGALILGDAAVSASLVSPILIIIVAITGICSFSIPDFSLNFTFRICRFAYIILGYAAGFLGIGIGIFIQLSYMCSLESFGAQYLNPSLIKKRSISNYFVLPIWKRERVSSFTNPAQESIQEKISMKWRKK